MAASFVIAKVVIRSISSIKKGRKLKPSSSRMVMANSLGKGRDCLIQTMILTMKESHEDFQQRSRVGGYEFDSLGS